jgi:hypothetical protein
MLITYIKGGTLAQIFLERGSAMTRDYEYLKYKTLVTEIRKTFNLFSLKYSGVLRFVTILQGLL